MHPSSDTSHVDVIIIGAGLSGIGAAAHLRKHCPSRSILILEARATLGGTWDLFRYPGIRSDSDMHTMGYHFKPWRESKSIADGPSILRYIQETAREYSIEEHIRYQHQVTEARWITDQRRWMLRVKHVASQQDRYMTCSLLHLCAGYYDYERGHVPDFPNQRQFKGEILHPQHWPARYEYRDQRIVIIGSGATAITLVPNLAKKAQHVVMLQRSPTYIVAWPDQDRLAKILNFILPQRLAYALIRWKNIKAQRLGYALARAFPKYIKNMLLSRAHRYLKDPALIEEHFNPRYNPWEQRVCLAPNGDFFRAITEGRASVVTGHIERFEPDSILLKSGRRLRCDAVVMATGLKLRALGGMSVYIDHERVNIDQHWSYRGVLYSGIPNLFTCFGYINASWTLRADLVSRFVCRVLEHMDKTGTQVCTPELRPSDLTMKPRPWIEGFSPNYFKRAPHVFPMQGEHEPWVNPQDHAATQKLLIKDPLDDGVLMFR